jgi:hypothetical protein
MICYWYSNNFIDEVIKYLHRICRINGQNAHDDVYFMTYLSDLHTVFSSIYYLYYLKGLLTDTWPLKLILSTLFLNNYGYQNLMLIISKKNLAEFTHTPLLLSLCMSYVHQMLKSASIS